MKRTNKLPTISVVTATKNSIRTIEQCLSSIRHQEYPQENIEIIIADGGSTDGTLNIAQTYGASVVSVDTSLQNAEYNKSIGISKAKNEIIAMIDHDNILPHTKWFSRMVRPFMERADVVGVETLRYLYEPQGTLLDRYFALFGSGDPLVWYLGKTDRLSYMYDEYTLAGRVLQKKPYYVVQFTEDTMPTIGANGFLVRRDKLFAYADVRPGHYFDMDVNIDLIRSGFSTYAFVDQGIIHKTGYGSIWYYFKRRMLFMDQYHMGGKNSVRGKYRRFHMVSTKNARRLIFAVVASLTLVIPLIDSFRGWLRVRDRAWFLHPLMAIGFVLVYSWVIMKHSILTYANKILGK